MIDTQELILKPERALCREPAYITNIKLLVIPDCKIKSSTEQKFVYNSSIICSFLYNISAIISSTKTNSIIEIKCETVLVLVPMGRDI